MAHFILLTGLIGAGKSTVADLLRKKHYIVVDTDSEAKALYRTPEVFLKAVSTFGKDILAPDGGINKDALKERVFDPDERTEAFLSFLADRLARDIKTEYGSSYEVIFVEAACTPQLNLLIDRLYIREILFVTSPQDVRHDRLRKTRGMGNADIERVEDIQRKAHDRIFYPCTSGPVKKVIDMMNNGAVEDLPGVLDNVLSERIGWTSAERFALYERYLRESPDYCKENAWCYSFYNMGGCESCPFPCGRRQVLFERAEKIAAESDTAD